MKAKAPAIAALVVLGFTAIFLFLPVRAVSATPTNIDVSQRSTNESEETIAVNPA